MRNYELETKQRVEFIQGVLDSAGANGVVYGNSGGKDSALVGVLCKMACADTVGLIMPCGSKRNYEEGRNGAEMMAALYTVAVSERDKTIIEKFHRSSEHKRKKPVIYGG